MIPELTIAATGPTPEGWDTLADWCEDLLVLVGKQIGSTGWDRGSRKHGVEENFREVIIRCRYDRTLGIRKIRRLADAQFDTFQNYADRYGIELQNWSDL